MLEIALLKMEQEFSKSALVKAQKYCTNGNVLNVKLSDGLLRARVKGSSGHIYNVNIDLKIWPKTPAKCSCAEHFNCKHIAACFLSLQTRENLSIVTVDVPYEAEVDLKNNLVNEILEDDEVIYAESASWYSDYKVTTNDFFAYQLGILIDGQQVSIVPLIINLLKSIDVASLDGIDENKLINLPLEKNKWLQIEFSRIKPLLRVLLSYGVDANKFVDNLNMKEYQLSLLYEAELAIHATNARWHGTESIRNKLFNLTNQTQLPDIQKPNGLMATLRDYQQLGLNWLQYLRNNNFSGILADDMGLGKTIQALANLQYEKEANSALKANLIVAPTSLVWNWHAEALKFTPNLKVLVYHGFDRHDVNFDEYDLIISTYGVIQRDKVRFVAYKFHYLILDEAQFIKNSKAKTTKIIQQLQATHRLCLTGTPLENNLGELWSLFNFLMPGMLGSLKQFRQFFQLPIEKDNDLAKKHMLHGRISPFMLRRTKTDVRLELPTKTEIIRKIDLIGPQRDLYEAMRLSMEQKVRGAIAELGIAKSQILLLDALLKLRQVCCNPRLVSLDSAKMALGSSAKLDALMELLDSLMEEGRFVLIFSQFTSMLSIIESVLGERHYKYFKLTGDTKNRQEIVDKFQNGEAQIFLISLRAGGVGLNLTKADTVILYDPWWNPAVQEQAAGRSHRIGQENPVFIYKLIASGSVEEVILDIQNKKQDLFDSVLTNQAIAGAGLSADDIDKFFAPLS